MNDWWPTLAIAAVAATVIGWAWWPTRSDYRSRNDVSAAARITGFQDRPEPAAPGSDDLLLAQCQAICPDLARKEDR
jgi:hypothetical protein